jgi:3-oxoacyl-[acyl-carrier protein] reductase
MDLGLRGKVAVVAAASRGLGRAVATELAGEGARLVICARGADMLARTRDEIAAASGTDIHAVEADLATLQGVERVAVAAERAFGQVDILVNNAGGPPSGPFESHEWPRWEEAVHLTLRSAVELTRRVLPGMRERKWGRVLNITSIAVKQPVDGLILSNSLRAAVTGWARTLANEVARDGVTVNNILPGFTQRGDSRARRDNSCRGKAAERVPDSHAANRRPARVRRAGRVPGQRTRQLHHGAIRGRGRRLDPIATLSASAPASAPRSR